MVKIGLIDSGVKKDLHSRLSAACGFTLNENTVTEIDDIEDQLGHGTGISEVVLSQNPDCQLYVAKVFFKRLACNIFQISAAIDWMIKHNVAIINLSFGLASDRPALASACQRANKAGTILVASSPAQGKPVYPASYPGIIKATADARCKPGQISWLSSKQADYGGHLYCGEETVRGSSAGCAWVTAALAKYLDIYKSRKKAIAALQQNACYQYPERFT